MDEKLISRSHSHLFRAYMDRQADKTTQQRPAITPTMEAPLKPQFYVLRQNGNATPLIAMDELPQHITVDGVPRLLSIADIDDMTRMPGKHEVRQNVYTVVDNSKPPAITIAVPPESGFGFPKAKTATNQSAPPANEEEIFPGPKKYFGIEEEAPKQSIENVTQDVASKSASVFETFEPLPDWKATPNIGDRRPLKGKKIYCSHWMSTGECDYAQQGCLYKHEMPLDIDLLQHLGFRDIPKWYRERHGIGKLTAVPGSGAHIEGPADAPGHMHSSWRPLVNQRLPKASPLASARTRVFPPHLNRRTTSVTVLAPRPTRTVPQDLISLESRPATPLAADGSRPNNSLLNSKFASLEPASEKSKSQDSQSSRSVSSPDSTYARLNEDSHITPNTSVESLAGLKLQEMSMNHISRRTSIATDYETGLFQEQKERDEQEYRTAAELDAIAASRKEQAQLKDKQEAALAIAKETMLAGQRGAGNGNQRNSGLKKGGRRNGPSRGVPKRNESVKGAIEISA